MRSVDSRFAAALLGLALGGCASVKEPLQAVQQKMAAAAAPAASAVAAAVPYTPVPADAQRAFDDARALLRAGRVAEAERAFKALAAQHPDLGGAHANLGLIARNAGRHDEAIAAGEASVKVSPRQPVFHHQLALSYRMKGRMNDARAAYERALELDPAYADAHLNLGILLDLYLGESALALTHFERYVALAPNGSDVAVGKWIADIDRTQIIGNRELPKVLMIVPWKKPLPGELAGRPLTSVLDEALAPVDRDVFRRQVSYHTQVAERSAAPAEKKR